MSCAEAQGDTCKYMTRGFFVADTNQQQTLLQVRSARDVWMFATWQFAPRSQHMISVVVHNAKYPMSRPTSLWPVCSFPTLYILDILKIWACKQDVPDTLYYKIITPIASCALLHRMTACHVSKVLELAPLTAAVISWNICQPRFDLLIWRFQMP